MSKPPALIKPTPLLRKLLILRLLAKSPTTSQNEMARRLHYAVSAVNRLVRELQTEGLVIRQADGWLVTDSGRRFVQEWTETYNEQLQAMKAMDPIWAPDSSRKPLFIGVVRALGTAVPLVAKRIGLFEAARIAVEEKLYDYASDMLGDLAEDRISFGCGGMAAFLEAKGQGMTPEILAACNSGGHALVIKSNLGIENVSDLEGRTILLPLRGTVTDRLFVDYLHAQCPSIEVTLQLDRSISPANMPFAFVSNDRYAAMVTWEPWVSVSEILSEDVTVLVDFARTWQDAVGRPYSTSVLIAQASTVVANRDLVESILKIHRNTIRFLNEHPTRANEVLAATLNVPTDVIERARTRVTFHSDLHW